MSAIPTLWTSGSFAGFTNPDGTITDVLGEATPSTPTTTSTLISDTALVEVDSASSTVGSQVRVTVNGGLEVGSKVRAILEYTDQNNYTFAELEKGGITVFADLRNDRLRIGKRESGVERWLTGATPLADGQQDYGDLRNYTVTAGGTLTLMKVLDMYVAKASLTDAEDGLHENDVIIAQEFDGPATATTKKVGVQMVGSVHTNTIGLLQGGLITAKFCSPAGNDSNTGAENAPYLTIKKLMENVAVNQLGVIAAGTYNEAVGQGGASPLNSTTLANGTSYEDAPLFMARGTVVQAANATAVYYVKGAASFRYFYGWTMDGNTNSNYGVKLFAQADGGSGLVPKRFRFHRMEVMRAKSGGNVELNHGTFFGEPTAAEHDQYHHFLDCVIRDGDSALTVSQGTHGFYVESSRNKVEWSRLANNEGDGLKFFFGTAGGFAGVPVSNHNMIRYCRVEDNGQYGIILSGGVNNYAHNNVITGGNIRTLFGGGSSVGVGLMIGFGAINNWAWNNVAFQNAGAGFSVEGVFGAQVTGAKLINNTAHDNKYNFQIVTSSSPATAQPDDILFLNNVANGFSAGGLNFAFVANSSASTTNPSHATNLTFTTNHESVNVGDPFGAIFGDPLFMDEVSGDFRLTSTSSPLYQAGTNPTAYLTADFDRRPVPQSAAYEIGAFAYPSPFTGLPINQILSTYQATVSVAKDLTLSVVHPTGDISGTATSEAGVWLKTSAPADVTIT